MHKAFKYRLYPTPPQAEQLEKSFGCARFIWNWALRENRLEYEYTRRFVFGYSLKMQLPKLKKQFPWLSEVPSQALQQKCDDFDKALRAVWERGNGFPKAKKKRVDNSFRIPQTNGHIQPTQTQIKLPKLGWVKWSKHRPLEGKLKSITIRRENTEYYISCLCEIEGVDEPKPQTDLSELDIVGIDLGLKDFAITSDGECFDTPKFFRKQQKRMAWLQRRAARKKKGSEKRAKAQRRVAKLHARIRHQRENYTHQASSAITKQYLIVGVENLNIKGMVKNKRLSKAIADQGWRQFTDQLAYKSRWNGGATVRIDRWAPSTKTCSCCGHKQPMPLELRIFECENCGESLNRDLNAAINIRQWTQDEINRWGTHRIHAQGVQGYVHAELGNILGIGPEAIDLQI